MLEEALHRVQTHLNIGNSFDNIYYKMISQKAIQDTIYRNKNKIRFINTLLIILKNPHILFPYLIRINSLLNRLVF